MYRLFFPARRSTIEIGRYVKRARKAFVTSAPASRPAAALTPEPQSAPAQIPEEPIAITSEAAEAAGPTAPRAKWVIPTHIAAVTLIQSTWMAIGAITPILAIKGFHAGYWQSLLITAT